TALGLFVALVGYLYPVVRYLQRSGHAKGEDGHALRPTLRRMLLGSCLAAVALTSTWGAAQWIPSWADNLAGNPARHAKEYTQIFSAVGAILGTVGGALLGNWLSRRVTYSL